MRFDMSPKKCDSPVGLQVYFSSSARPTFLFAEASQSSHRFSSRHNKIFYTGCCSLDGPRTTIAVMAWANCHAPRQQKGTQLPRYHPWYGKALDRSQRSCARSTALEHQDTDATQERIRKDRKRHAISSIDVVNSSDQTIPSCSWS